MKTVLPYQTPCTVLRSKTRSFLHDLLALVCNKKNMCISTLQQKEHMLSCVTNVTKFALSVRHHNTRIQMTDIYTLSYVGHMSGS